MLFRAQTQWHSRDNSVLVPLRTALFILSSLSLSFHSVCISLIIAAACVSRRLPRKALDSANQTAGNRITFIKLTDGNQMKTFILLAIDFVAVTWRCTDALRTQPISSPCDIKTSGDPRRARCASVPVCGFVFRRFRGAIMAAFSQSFYQRSPRLLSETRKWIRCQRSRRVCEQGRTEEMQNGAGEMKVTLWCKRCKEIWNLTLIAQCRFNTQRIEIITIVKCDSEMFIFFLCDVGLASDVSFQLFEPRSSK